MVFVLDGVIDRNRVRFPLDPGRTRVGRVPRNELVLAEKTVSREHAELTISEDGIDIRDLGSTNGTFVDGERVFDTVELRVGQTIRFGTVELKLVEGSSLDRLTSSDRPVLSPPGATVYRPLGGGREPAETGQADAEAEVDLLSVISDAGRLLVQANTPQDAVEEICGLIRKVVPWLRAVVLVCDPVLKRPEVAVVSDLGQPAQGMLLLSEGSWNTLIADRLPLLVEPAAGFDPKREETVAGSPAGLQALLVPLQVRGRAFGCLYLEASAGALGWTGPRSRALLVLADLLSVRLSQARLFRTLRDRERLEREVSVAARVQRGLLSNARFDLGDYEALARQIPCYEVGGDLYDISALEDGRVMLVLGDASGKGMGAAMLMSNAVATLRALYGERLGPSELAQRLHRQLLRFTEPAQFITLFLGILDPAEDLLEYVNAGHCPPVLVSIEGRAEHLAGTGPPLGLLPGASFGVESVRMQGGSTLCAYSDGVTEASIAGEFYGEERLEDALRRSMGLPSQELLDRLIRDVRGFVQEQPLDDDLTVLVLRRRAASGGGRTAGSLVV